MPELTRMGLRARLRQRVWHLRDAARRRLRPGREDFWIRYHEMPNRVVVFLQACGVDIRDQRLAALGCGDGVICLGLYRALRPSLIVGYETPAPTEAGLTAHARGAGVLASIPPGLHFSEYVPEGIPAPDRSFDAAVVAASWSDFGDLVRPIAAARRVVRPEGLLVVALSRGWPGRFVDGADGDNVLLQDMSLDEVQAAVLAGGGARTRSSSTARSRGSATPSYDIRSPAWRLVGW